VFRRKKRGVAGPARQWLKLDCLYHNLQKVQLHARRKDARNRCRILRRPHQLSGATFGMRSDAQRGYLRRCVWSLNRAITYDRDERGIA
jgi:hypothetical protein